jgi:hypothetical protein
MAFRASSDLVIAKLEFDCETVSKPPGIGEVTGYEKVHP